MPVALLTTGGTIATHTGDDGVARPARSGANLLTAAGADAVTVVEVMSVDSSAMNPQRWQQLAAAIEDQVQRGADGIVVTHGTDTLEETALWLALTTDPAVPVVLTGAQRSANHPDADGPGNLRDALAVASSPAGKGLGVVVCFAGEVFPAVGTRKLDLARAAGFGGSAPIARIVEGDVVVNGSLAPTYLGAAGTPPRVDIVSVYPGADAVALDACVAAGARGVVLTAMGSGNVNDAVLESVSRHVRDGVCVAVGTRVPTGTVAPGYEPGRRIVEAGAIMVPHLRSGQARVLIMAALATGSDVGEVVGRLG